MPATKFKEEEITARISEAEQWLTCECTVCVILRAHLGQHIIQGYIERLKEILSSLL